MSHLRNRYRVPGNCTTGSHACSEQVSVKQAILATVVSVEKHSLDSVVVRLQSEALKDASEIVSTGLNLERNKKRSGSRLDVVCQGDPMAVPGDKVPVVVKADN